MDRRQKLFLERYEYHGAVAPAAKDAGFTLGDIARMRAEDAAFATACVEAHQAAVDNAEAELYGRAIRGASEPVMWRGEPVYERDPETGNLRLDANFDPVPLALKRKSDKLLELYMRSNRENYADRQKVALGNDNDEPLKIQWE